MRPDLHVHGEEPGDDDLDALARTLPGSDPGSEGSASMRAAVLFAISRSRRRRLLAWRVSGVAAFALSGIIAAAVLWRFSGEDEPPARLAETPTLTRIEQGTGRVTYDVAPRRPGERFVVGTPEAEIEVRGTRFSVDVEDGRTEVDVEHGRVEVREAGTGTIKAVLEKGQRTAVRRAPAPVASVPVPSVPFEPAIGGGVGAGTDDPFRPGHVGAPPPRAQGTRPPQDAELRLFRAAHELHFQNGDMDAALVAWNRYLAAYPRGALAEEARYNRAVCLLRLGRTREAGGDLSTLASDPGAFRAREAKLLQAASLRREGRCDEAEQLLAPLRQGNDEIARRATALPPCR